MMLIFVYFNLILLNKKIAFETKSGFSTFEGFGHRWMQPIYKRKRKRGVAN
jgi:hypothetical protein